MTPRLTDDTTATAAPASEVEVVEVEKGDTGHIGV